MFSFLAVQPLGCLWLLLQSHGLQHSRLLCPSCKLSIFYIVSTVYMCQSQPPNSSHPLLFPLISIQLFSTTMSLFLLCKWHHLYCFSRFHINVLINDICFSISNLLHSVWHSQGPSTPLKITKFRSFLWLSNIPFFNKKEKNFPKVTELIHCRIWTCVVWNPELTCSSDQEEAYQTINRSFLDDELKIIYIFFLKCPEIPNFFLIMIINTCNFKK